jgi:hypothetical protein
MSDLAAHSGRSRLWSEGSEILAKNGHHFPQIISLIGAGPEVL